MKHSYIARTATVAALVCLFAYANFVQPQEASSGPKIERVIAAPDWTSQRILLSIHGTGIPQDAKLMSLRSGTPAEVDAEITVSDEQDRLTAVLTPATFQQLLTHGGRTIDIAVGQQDNVSPSFRFEFPAVELLPRLETRDADGQKALILTARNLFPGFRVYLSPYATADGRLFPRIVSTDTVDSPHVATVQQTGGDLAEIRIVFQPAPGNGAIQKQDNKDPGTDDIKNPKSSNKDVPPRQSPERPANKQPANTAKKGPALTVGEIFNQTNQKPTKKDPQDRPRDEKGREDTGGFKDTKKDEEPAIPGGFGAAEKNTTGKKATGKKASAWRRAVYVLGPDGSRSRVLDVPAEDQIAAEATDIQTTELCPAMPAAVTLEIEVPDVTGMFLGEAIEKLQGIGLAAVPVDADALREQLVPADSPLLDSSLVQEQGLAPGSKVGQGSKLLLQLSRNEGLKPGPDVVAGGGLPGINDGGFPPDMPGTGLPPPQQQQNSAEAAKKLAEWIASLFNRKSTDNGPPGKGPTIQPKGPNPKDSGTNTAGKNDNDKKRPEPKMGPRLVKKQEGPSEVKIPAFVGKELKAAKQLASANGLELSYGKGKFLEDVVSAQKPGKGWQKAVATVKVEVGVPVPDVTTMQLKKASDLLTAWDLKASYPDGAFTQDKVLKQDPPPHTPENPSTVPHGSLVKLIVGLRVPDVTKMNLKKAKEHLKTWDLVAKYPDGSFQEDTVVGQEPKAGTFAPHKAEIVLDVRLPVPKVVGQRLKDAKKLIELWDLKTKYEDGSFFEDLVVSQSPEPGELVKHDELVKLTVKVQVPSVAGLSAEKARDLLIAWDLDPQIANALARDEDTVRGQSPAAGSYVFHKSKVTLGPVYARVPDLTGMTIAQASNLLQAENFQANFDNRLRDGDQVTAQNPLRLSELERGKTVVLDARVFVPNVTNKGIFDAAQLVRQAPGDLDVDYNGKAYGGDLAGFQNPAAGSRVLPRTTVVLTPVVRVPNLFGLTRAQADDALRNRHIDGRTGQTNKRETSDGSKIGRTLVESQSPASGTYITRNSAVIANFAQYVQDTVIVPNVTSVGERLVRPQAAVQTLRDRGLNFAFFDTHHSNKINGNRRERVSTHEAFERNHYIEAQSPRAGTRVPRGTTIELEVAGEGFEENSDSRPKGGGGAGWTGTRSFSGSLVRTDSRFAQIGRPGSYFDAYPLFLQAGQSYRITLFSGDFDAYLIVFDSNNKIVAQDDDDGGGRNSALTYRPTRSGTYRIVATSFRKGDTGNYRLIVSR